MTTTEAPTNKGSGAPTRPEDEGPQVRIDPRIKERLIEVQRAAGRRRLRILLIVSCVLSTLGLAYLFVMSPFLNVDHIAVTGDHHVTPKQVRAAARVHRGDHLLLVDTGAVARRIERIPWVQKAEVHRDLPGTLRVTLTEYRPAAFVRAGSAVMLVAANGHVIARAVRAPVGTVEIRGVRRAPAAGQVLAPAGVASVVPHLPPALAQQVEAVDVSGSGIALELRGSGEIRLGNALDLAAKAASAQAVLDHLAGTPFSYIDVSTPDRAISHA